MSETGGKGDQTAPGTKTGLDEHPIYVCEYVQHNPKYRIEKTPKEGHVIQNFQGTVTSVLGVRKN